jgi:hypothetical protein
VESGDITIPVTLSLSHALSGGPFNLCATQTPGNSTLRINLTTTTIPSAITGTLFGAPLNRATGQVTLVGSGALTGGASQLDGVGVDLVMFGRFACDPLP